MLAMPPHVHPLVVQYREETLIRMQMEPAPDDYLPIILCHPFSGYIAAEAWLG